MALNPAEAAARTQQIARDGRRSVQALPPRGVLKRGGAQAILLRQSLVFREVLKFSDGRCCGLAPAPASPVEAAWPAGVTVLGILINSRASGLWNTTLTRPVPERLTSEMTWT